MSSIETQTENVEGAPDTTTSSLSSRLPIRRDRRAVVRLAVCTVTLWLVVLLLALLVVVGVYTSRANQILVVSSVSVVSIALVVASCKLNSIAGIHKMVEEDMAAKSDPPPKYEDVLHTEAPPPPYYAVVSEAAGGAATPTGAISKHGAQAAKVVSPACSRRSPALRRWLNRPGILQTLVSPSMFRAQREASPPSPLQPQKTKDRSLVLRRTSSTPSLAGMASQPSLARWPSSPSICDGCAWF